MSRRPSLPGADELFRRTDPARPAQEQRGSAAAVREGAAERDLRAVPELPTTEPEPGSSRRVAARRRTPAPRRPTGRERHEEKITVYVSAEELLDLEHAKLTLRAQHGLAVDRGRIVREAVAVIVADLESKGEDSILVRRLRGD